MKKNIAVIDNGIDHISIDVFNKFVDNSDYCFTLHLPAKYGIDSLKKLKHIDGIIILGSNSNVTEFLDWQIQLSKIIIQKIKKGIPTLGICFGHQLITQGFGGIIGFRNPEHLLFNGTRTISLLKNISSLPEYLHLGFAHMQEIKKLPKTMIQLATSDLCKYEMVKHKKYPFIGIQGHPEITEGFIQRNFTKKISKKELKKIQNDGNLVLNYFFSLIK